MHWHVPRRRLLTECAFRQKSDPLPLLAEVEIEEPASDGQSAQLRGYWASLLYPRHSLGMRCLRQAPEQPLRAAYPMLAAHTRDTGQQCGHHLQRRTMHGLESLTLRHNAAQVPLRPRDTHLGGMGHWRVALFRRSPSLIAGEIGGPVKPN